MSEIRDRKPCKQCPYRKNSSPGYLGESSGDPERFLIQLQTDELHPCHLSVDWDAIEALEASGEDFGIIPLNPDNVCIGALQFMNNTCQRSRYKAVRELQKEAGTNEDVIESRKAFIERHTL